MDRMLYVAMSGAKETALSQANNSNNLANANTPGFKEDLNQFRSMPVYGDGFPTRVYALSERPQVSFDNGPVNHTGRELDVAVMGDGWFAVQGADGNEAYTRRGDLKVDVNGLLTNGAGDPIIGNGGPIAIPPAEKIEIGADGTISVRALGQGPGELAIIDRIKLVNPSSSDLEKGQDGLLRMKNGEPLEAEGNLRVSSGSLESSNISVVDSMVTMIELARKFEFQVKLMKTAEEIDNKSATLMRQT